MRMLIRIAVGVLCHPLFVRSFVRVRVQSLGGKRARPWGGHECSACNAMSVLSLRVFAGTNTHTTHWHSHLRHGVATLCDAFGSGRLHVTVNVWDQPPSNEAQQQTPACSKLTHVRGAKPIFWKTISEAAVAAFDVVWLFDDDMLVWPPAFAPDAVLATQFALNASIATPGMMAQVDLQRCPPDCQSLGRTMSQHCTLCRGTDRKELLAESPNPECMARAMPLSELQSVFFRRDAWVAAHGRLLMQLPHSRLFESDWMLSHAWCGLMRDVFPERPSCVRTQHPLAHLNFNSIGRWFGKVNGSTHKRTNLLYRRGDMQALAARARETQPRCWSVQELAGLQAPRRRAVRTRDNSIPEG